MASSSDAASMATSLGQESIRFQQSSASTSEGSTAIDPRLTPRAAPQLSSPVTTFVSQPERPDTGNTRRATWEMLRGWEGRDRLMQLAQSLLLAMHHSLRNPLLIPSFVFTKTMRHPTRSSALRRIYVASEAVTNARRILLLMRWAMDIGELGTLVARSASSRLTPGAHARRSSSDGKDIAAENLAMIGRDWYGANTFEREAQGEKDILEHNPVEEWKDLWEFRLRLLSDALASMGDACDVGAFLAGTGLAWRVGRRQRKGLERVSVYFGFASILVSLLLCRLLKLRTRSRLRAAHRRILSATDRIGWASSLAGTKIASTSSLSSQRIPSRPSTEDYDGCGPPGRVWSALADTESPTRPEPAGGQELTELARKNSIPGPDDESEVVEPLQELGISLISNSELDDTSSDASALSARSQTSADAQMLIAAGEAEMLSSEAELQKAKRELSWLRWERWGLWADGSFVGWELVAPHKEKEALEAWTSVFSSLVAIARLWSEALRSE